MSLFFVCYTPAALGPEGQLTNLVRLVVRGRLGRRRLVVGQRDLVYRSGDLLEGRENARGGDEHAVPHAWYIFNTYCFCPLELERARGLRPACGAMEIASRFPDPRFLPACDRTVKRVNA